MQIDLAQAQTEAETLFQMALNGEEVVITQDERPILKLTRVIEEKRLTAQEFEALADRVAEEFNKLVTPETPLLSDYAVSREGIYEDHP